MPQIPVVAGRTVKPRGYDPGYQDSSVPPNAFGQETAEVIGRAGAALTVQSNAQQAAQERADYVRVNADLATFDSERQALTDAALQKNGKDAIGASADAYAAIEARAKELSAGLANDSQRDKFVPNAQRMATDARSAVLRHEAKQAEVLADQSAVARIANASNAAAKYPEMISGALADADSAVASRAVANGWSDEITQAQQAEARSGVLSSVLGALDGAANHSEFLKFYVAHEGELTSKDREHWSKVYAQTDDLTKQQATVDGILKNNPNDQRAAIDAARATLSGKEEENAVQAIKVRFAERDEVRKDYERGVLDKAWEAFEAGGSRLSAVPRETLLQMRAFSGETEQQMKNIEEQDANRSSSPKRSDLALWGNWILQSPEWKRDPKNHPMTVLRGKVTDEDMRYALREVEDLNNFARGLSAAGKTPAGPSLDNETTQGMVDTAIRENAAFFYEGDKITSDEKVGGFEKYVRNEVDAFQAHEGRRPNRIEAQKIIDEALIEGERKTGKWYLVDTDIRKFEAKRGDAFVPDKEQVVEAPVGIPSADAARIEAILRNAGRPSDPVSIRQYYDVEQNMKARP